MQRFIILFFLHYLRFLAKFSLALHKPITIGIAGSVGKSSTREILYAILKDHVSVKEIVGNSETGIPLGILGIHLDGFTPWDWMHTLWRAPLGLWYLHNTQYLIVEMGIDEPLPPKNMAYLLSIVRPTIAISLNISATHTMQFESLLPKTPMTPEEKSAFLLRAIADEDTKIITASGCKTGIFNADDSYVVDAINTYKKTTPSTTLVSFGEKKENNISYKEYTVTEEGTIFSFLLPEKQIMEIRIRKFMLPRVYFAAIGASLLAAQTIGIDKKKAISSLEKNFVLPKGRAGIFQGINNTIIIDSSYNASKTAVLTFLDLVYTLKEQTHRPVVVLLGDMRELGGEAEKEHEEVAKKIIERTDALYCIGPLTKEYVLPLVTKKIPTVQWFTNAVKAGKYLRDAIPANAIVLVKGSQNTLYLEEAIKYLLQSKDDEKNLCRQSPFWLRKKTSFFLSQQ